MDIPKTYKTLRLSENELEIITREVKHSSEPQLIMRPRLVGICRSDIKEFLGTRTVRHDFGHEILAEVVSSNAHDPRLPSVGSLVVLDPHVKISRSSGFGELVVATGIVENLSKAFIKVPNTIIDRKLIFTEPLACAHHCVANLLRFEGVETLDGLSVGIVGAGMTGILIGLLCKHYGAAVTILNRSEERLNFLRATGIFDENELSLMDAKEQEFDVVIPTTTFLFPEVLSFCKKIVRSSGLVLLYGGTKSGDVFPSIKEVDIDAIRRNQSMTKVSDGKKEFRLCGTHGATTEDFMAIIRLLGGSSKNIPVEKLISRDIRLEDVPQMLLEMTRGEVLGKTIVCF